MLPLFSVRDCAVLSFCARLLIHRRIRGFWLSKTGRKTPDRVRCISNLSAEHNLGDLSTSTNVKIFPASVHLWCSAGGWLKHNQSATNLPSVDMFGALVLNARYLLAKKVLQS